MSYLDWGTILTGGSTNEFGSSWGIYFHWEIQTWRQYNTISISIFQSQNIYFLCYGSQGKIKFWLTTARGTIDLAGILDWVHPCKDICNRWTIDSLSVCTLKTHGTTTKSYLTFTQKIELQLIVRASVSHVIPVKKNKENDFSMEFSASSKSREIDRSEGFHRIRSIFGAAFDVASHAGVFRGACFSSLVGRDEKRLRGRLLSTSTSPPFLSTLVLLRSKQCFGFA